MCHGCFEVDRIVFWTHAYNAEDTIGRAMESILSQTHGNFVYYCLDNGSTDKTGEIINAYAEKDARIVSLREQINTRNVIRKYLPRFLAGDDDGYFAILDADDEYAPDFLEKMLRFVTENSLDIAVCGTEYMEPREARPDAPERTIIFENEGFAACFPIYCKYITRMWGILYTLKLLPYANFGTFEEMGLTTDEVPGYRELTTAQDASSPRLYDCVYTLRAFRRAKRAGLLAESLHKYYVNSPTQLSVQYSPNYFWWVNFVQKRAREFLIDYGPLSGENEKFLSIRYLIWLKYILPRIQNADVALEVRMNDVFGIFTDEKVNALFSLNWKTVGIYSDKAEILREPLDWALEQKPGNLECFHAAQALIELLRAKLDKVKEEP